MRITSQKGLSLVEMLISAALLSLMVLAASVMYETSVRSYFEMRNSTNDFSDAMIGVEKVIKMAKMANFVVIETRSLGGKQYSILKLRADVNFLGQPNNTPGYTPDDAWITYVTALTGTPSGGIKEVVGYPSTNPPDWSDAALNFLITSSANVLARQDVVRPVFSFDATTGRFRIDVSLDTRADPYALFNQADGQSYEKVHNTKTFSVSTLINAPVTTA